MDRAIRSGFCLLAGILFLLVIAPAGEGITNYDIRVAGQKATVNMTFELYSSSAQEKVNYWQTSISLPPQSTILSLRDTKGPITGYTFADGDLAFQTSKGLARNKEVVTILFEAGEAVEAPYSPLRKLALSLSGFGDKRPDVPDEVTTALVALDQQALSESHSFGFVSSIKGDEVRFQGDGPLNFFIYYSSQGEQFQHYVLFGSGENLSVPDNMYGVVVAITGTLPSFDLFPVVVLPDQRYEEEVNGWSAGQYMAGVVFVKASAVDNGDFPSTLLHETTHGFNEEALRWSSAKATWFDEGVAKYVEFVANKKLGVRQAEIFGEPVQWVEGTRIYTLPPRSTPEELWNYYQKGEGEGFMEDWNPKNANTREFGYAFSELVVRDFINRGGDLQEVYRQLLEQKEEVDTNQEFNSIILGLLGSDFRPCSSPSRQAFEDCLKEINRMDPEVPSNVVIKGVPEEIIIPEISPPEEQPLPVSIFERILSSLTSFFSWLFGLFRG